MNDINILSNIKCLRTIHNRGHELIVLEGQLLADVLSMLSSREVIVQTECVAECKCLNNYEPEVYRVNSIRCSGTNKDMYSDMHVECSDVVNYLIEQLHITPYYIMPHHVHIPPDEPSKAINDDFYTYKSGIHSVKAHRDRMYPVLNECNEPLKQHL